MKKNHVIMDQGIHQKISSVVPVDDIAEQNVMIVPAFSDIIMILTRNDLEYLKRKNLKAFAENVKPLTCLLTPLFLDLICTSMLAVSHNMKPTGTAPFKDIMFYIQNTTEMSWLKICIGSLANTGILMSIIIALTLLFVLCYTMKWNQVISIFNHSITNQQKELAINHTRIYY